MAKVSSVARDGFPWYQPTEQGIIMGEPAAITWFNFLTNNASEVTFSALLGLSLTCYDDVCQKITIWKQSRTILDIYERDLLTKFSG